VAKSRKSNNGGGTGKLTSGPAGASARHDLFVIDDESLLNPVIRDKVFCPVVGGEVKGHGLVPRDRSKYPPAMFDPPSGIPIIPKSEWDARIAEQDREQSSLEHLRMRGSAGQMISALDQNSQGFCWAYSTTMAVMLLRAVANLPHVRLSGHAVGCMVKNFRDEGGWCGLSAKFHREKGCPSVALWPEKSMSRSNDKPEVWANAALHKVSEDWVDLTRDVYDQNLTAAQIATCLLSGIPVAVDYNEWSHSICALRWVKVEGGSYAPKILNSWTDGWGDKGTGVIRASWDVDGAVALRVTGASAN
jgi:hypothetical protein